MHRRKRRYREHANASRAASTPSVSIDTFFMQPHMILSNAQDTTKNFILSYTESGRVMTPDVVFRWHDMFTAKNGPLLSQRKCKISKDCVRRVFEEYCRKLTHEEDKHFFPHRHQQISSISHEYNKRRRRRLKPGTKALREIRRMQTSWNLLIPKLSFSRLVREIQTSFNMRFMRWTPGAIRALQIEAEDYLTHLFEDAQLISIHARRVTVMVKDIHLCRRIRKK